jgi:hypothetical protein
MPVIQNSVSVAANAVNDNIITGSQFEYLPYNARIDFGLVASATGLLVDVFTGQDIVAESFAPPTQNRFPLNPDDYTLSDVARGGERVKIRVRNTTGGALTIFYGIIITPIV